MTYILGVFLFAWLPYSVGSMYIVFIDTDGVGPMAETLPAIFAKSSMAGSAIYFIFSNKEIKAKFTYKLFTTRRRHLNQQTQETCSS